jgi:hypothetical protein
MRWQVITVITVVWLLSGCSLNTVKYDCKWKLKQQYNDPFVDVVECKK